MKFSDLPIEVRTNILFQLSPEDILTCLATCQQFEILIKNFAFSEFSRKRWLQYQGADLAATASEIKALLTSRLDDQAAANIAAHQGLATPVLQELLLNKATISDAVTAEMAPISRCRLGRDSI